MTTTTVGHDGVVTCPTGQPPDDILGAAYILLFAFYNKS